MKAPPYYKDGGKVKENKTGKTTGIDLTAEIKPNTDASKIPAGANTTGINAYNDYLKTLTYDGQPFINNPALNSAEGRKKLGDFSINSFNEKYPGKKISADDIKVAQAYHQQSDPSIIVDGFPGSQFSRLRYPNPTPVVTQVPEAVAQVDRKAIFLDNKTPYKIYDYPDPNAGYSKATRKYYDPKSDQEIDVANSFDENGNYSPKFIASQSTDTKYHTDTKTPYKEFKKGGLVKKYALGGLTEDEDEFQQTKSNDALMGAVGPTAANAVVPGSGQLVTAGLGLKKQWQDQAEEIDPLTGEFKDQKKADRYGLANGLLNASPLGALGTVLDKDKTWQEKALSVGTMGMSNAFTWKKDQQKTEDSNMALAQEKHDEINKKELDTLSSKNLSAALSQRELENYSEGGKIEGKGTAKSDSIVAKIKANSFVVPAEMVSEVKQVLKKILKAPPINKKANLNQKNGEVVRVSNGEFLISKDEVKELKNKGVNVSKFAPKAPIIR